MPSKPGEIRITDYAEPQYSDFARQIMASADGQSVDLSVDAVLQAASERVELIEPPVDYQERLGAILRFMREDDDLNPLGRMLHFGYCVNFVVQRTRLERLYLDHPEIDEVEIERPIIIAGLPRSGTSHMLNLISVDRRLRSLPLWESMEPFPEPAEAAQMKEGDQDPRIARCEQQLAMQDQILPHFNAMHEMKPWHIEEESHLMQIDFASALLDNFASGRRWMDFYHQLDHAQHYAYLRRILKALQWLRGPNRWILKTPQHMELLPVLQATFPDATYVLPHRDPVSIARSMISMIAYAARMSRTPVRPEKIAEFWLERIEHFLRGCVEDHHVLPEEQTVDVLFHEFMADDVATIGRIYRVADHPMTPEIEQQMRDYLVHHPRGKYGRIVYDLEGDFGVSTREVYRRYEFYTDRFDVRIEDPEAASAAGAG